MSHRQQMQVCLEGRTRGPRSTCADVLFPVNAVAAAFVKAGNKTVDCFQVQYYALNISVDHY